jgi:hypothetical protein
LAISGILTGAAMLSARSRTVLGWVAGVSICFLVAGWGLGWSYKSKLCHPACGFFFVVWTFLHLIIFCLVFTYWGFGWYVPVAIVELWIGYAAANRLFGAAKDKPVAES